MCSNDVVILLIECRYWPFQDPGKTIATPMISKLGGV